MEEESYDHYQVWYASRGKRLDRKKSFTTLLQAADFAFSVQRYRIERVSVTVIAEQGLTPGFTDTKYLPPST